MNVLVGCEFSGVVREAFRRRGHDAYSCDLEPAADGSPYHIQGDLRTVLRRGANCYRPQGHIWTEPTWWQLGIFHPPCTRLTNAGVRWLFFQGKGQIRDQARMAEMEQAAEFFELCLGEATNPIPKIAVENPIMHNHARELISRPYDQIIQPWQFGHGETKATCLWLRGLPLLQPTNIVEGRKPRVHHESPGPDRWKRRSITYRGIADAMAEQWGR